MKRFRLSTISITKRKSLFCAFLFIFLGFRLNAEVLLANFVSQKIDCVMDCAFEPCCRSINYKNTVQNEPNCEMLHNFVYNTSSDLLEKNSSYDHVYLVSPQKV